MLRDLDRRQAVDERRVFGQHLRPLPSANRLRWVLLAVGALSAAGAVGFALRGVDLARAPAVPHVSPVTAAPAPAPELPTPAAPAPQKVVVAAPVVAEPVMAKPAEAAAPKSQTRPTPPPVVEAKAVTAQPVAPMSIAPASIAPAAPEAPEGKIDKRFRETPGRTADGEFKRAAALIDLGRLEEAIAALNSAIAMDPRHEGARQTLAVLLIESGAMDDAERLLTDGLKLNPAQANFALVLARLKLDRGDAATALTLLREHGGAAAANAQYRAFVAALLQRLGRHSDAIDEYQAVLKLAPGVGVWWIGLGLSQEAADRTKEAAEAFRRAKASGTLSPDLLAFVERKLQAAR
jgi:MSHA biogenesis protein MshN